MKIFSYSIIHKKLKQKQTEIDLIWLFIWREYAVHDDGDQYECRSNTEFNSRLKIEPDCHDYTSYDDSTGGGEPFDDVVSVFDNERDNKSPEYN